MATAYINQRSIDHSSLKRWVLNGASPIAVAKFDALNAHLPTLFVRPGYMVIVPNNSHHESTADEAWLMTQAAKISQVLDRDPDAGAVLVDDYDLLQSFLGYGALGIGSATAAWNGHLNGVRRTLEQIEHSYARYKSGGLDANGFFEQRRQLLKQLNGQLKGAAQLGTGLRGNSSLRRILGISTKSYLHHGDIKGYAHRLERIAAITRHLRNGTFIGLALDTGGAGLQVKEACLAGREDECHKAQFVEGGRLVTGVAGAAFFGHMGAQVASTVCRIVLGVAIKGQGQLACAVIGGAAGGYAGGAVSGGYGAQWGEMLYVGDEPWI